MKTCCDGTGWTGQPGVICPKHYESVGDLLEWSHTETEEEPS